MVSRVKSMGLEGLSGYVVQVETDVSNGLPAFDIVGLPGAAVRESRDRVRAALRNSGFEFPATRITVNLAPADTHKDGPLYDLPILIGLLAATRQIPQPPEDCAFAGELSLSGQLRPAPGVLPMSMAAAQSGITAFCLPADSAPEAALVPGLAAYPAGDVRQLCDHLAGRQRLEPASPHEQPVTPDAAAPDFAEVKGQRNVKRALEIAAAGGHNVLLIGPPGSGKSMLARRMPGILPPMGFDERMDISRIHSAAGTLKGGALLRERPFRAPHHTISQAGLTGGGSVPRPGEISLGHGGVLFLDELPEFSRAALESLRQPLEDGRVTISRASGTVAFPSEFTLVCAMNPCRCGYFGHPTRRCSCTPPQVAQYLARVSGPLMDRIDLHVEVPPVPLADMESAAPGESSAAIRERVTRARAVQEQRLRETGAVCNARMGHAQVRRFCRPGEDGAAMLRAAFDSLGLTARSYDRILKVARTIADLDGAPGIDAAHIAEAVQYRTLDRKYWGQ